MNTQGIICLVHTRQTGQLLETKQSGSNHEHNQIVCLSLTRMDACHSWGGRERIGKKVRECIDVSTWKRWIQSQRGSSQKRPRPPEIHAEASEKGFGSTEKTFEGDTEMQTSFGARVCWSTDTMEELQSTPKACQKRAIGSPEHCPSRSKRAMGSPEHCLYSFWKPGRDAKNHKIATAKLMRKEKLRRRQVHLAKVTKT